MPDLTLRICQQSVHLCECSQHRVPKTLQAARHHVTQPRPTAKARHGPLISPPLAPSFSPLAPSPLYPNGTRDQAKRESTGRAIDTECGTKRRNGAPASKSQSVQRVWASQPSLQCGYLLACHTPPPTAAVIGRTLVLDGKKRNGVKETERNKSLMYHVSTHKDIYATCSICISGECQF